MMNNQYLDMANKDMQSDSENDSDYFKDHLNDTESEMQIYSASEDESDDLSDEDNRKIILQNAMNNLENQFNFLRETYCEERTFINKQKTDEIKAGKNKEYLHEVEFLEMKMKERIEVADALKNFQVQSIELMQAAEQLALRQDLEEKKNLLQDRLNEQLEEKIQCLKEDRSNSDIKLGFWLQKSYSEKKKKKSTISERKKKPVAVYGPYIVYSLPIDDIMDDWQQIKKATQAVKTPNLLKVR